MDAWQIAWDLLRLFITVGAVGWVGVLMLRNHNHEFDGLRAQQELAFAKLGSQIAQVLEEVSETDSENREALRRLTEVLDRISGMEQRINGVIERANLSDRVLGEIEDRVERLMNDRDTVKGRIENLEAVRLAELSADRDMLRDRIEKLEALLDPGSRESG